MDSIGHVITKDQLVSDKEYTDKSWGKFGSFKIAYRLQQPDGKFLFKIAFTPFIEYSLDSRISEYLYRSVYLYPSGGITFGYKFK